MTYAYVEILAVPTTSFINNPAHLSTVELVFVGKRDLIRCVLWEITRRSAWFLLAHKLKLKHMCKAWFSRRTFHVPNLTE